MHRWWISKIHCPASLDAANWIGLSDKNLYALFIFFLYQVTTVAINHIHWAEWKWLDAITVFSIFTVRSARICARLTAESIANFFRDNFFPYLLIFIQNNISIHISHLAKMSWLLINRFMHTKTQANKQIMDNFFLHLAKSIWFHAPQIGPDIFLSGVCNTERYWPTKS